MISRNNVRWHKFMKFCPEDYMLIENYDKALADNFKGWICHHINGEIKSREELIELGLYYNVPYYMLKFVTVEEHAKIHSAVRGKFKGHHHSHESKLKIGKASHDRQIGISKAQPAWNKGMRTSPKWSKVPKWNLSDETKKKHSEAMSRIWKARKQQEELNND